jgi:hypothetical protein
MATWLFLMPQIMNTRSLMLLCDEYGTVPSPLTEEEEVKHACSLQWSTLVYSTDDHSSQWRHVPEIADPFTEVEHREVDVPPPKSLV